MLLTMITSAIQSSSEQDLSNRNKVSSWTMEQVVLESVNRIEKIVESCGEICQTNQGSPDTVNGYLQKPLYCSKLLTNTLHDSPGFRFMSEVSKMIPRETLRYFNYNGRVSTTFVYQGFDLAPVRDWDNVTINVNAKLLTNGNFNIGYDETRVREMFEVLSDKVSVENKRVLVIGTNDQPWLETILIALGASHIVTLDWRGVQCNHSKIEIIRSLSLSRAFQTQPFFDLVIAYDSLQKLGLGRLGDGLHPWADLVILGRAWCVTKEGGSLLSVIPYTDKDRLIFNSYRVYGPIMETHLFANWAKLWSVTSKSKSGENEEAKISLHKKLHKEN